MATDPPLRAEEKTFRPVHLYGFLAHGDPRFAWLVKALGREDESDEVWQRIESASAVVDRSPFLMSRSRSMPGFGMEVLEAGADQADPRQKTAVVVRTGAGQGHGHCDTLGIALYARGCRALPDNGRRGGNPNSRASRVHNLVEVDDQDFLCTAYGRSGVGWAEAFKDLGDAGYVRASAAAPSHPNLKVYRRDVALVEVEAGEAYVADVFRVAGGRVHTWCCQGPVNSKPDMLELNAAMQPGDQGLPASYLKEKFSDKALGVAGDLLQAAWRVDPAAVTSYVGRKDNLPEVVVRAWHLGAAGRPVIRAWAHIRDYTKQGTPHNYVFVRNEGQEGLEGAYVTVTESYDVGKPLLQSVEFERIRRGASTGAMASRALKIRARGPQDDLVVFGGDGSEAVALEAGVRVQAQFALLSAGQKDLRKVAVVGGTLVEGRGFSIRPHAARYSAAVQEVDMAAGAVRLDKPFPVRGLEGASFLVQRPGAGHNAGYLVSRVEGDRVFLRGSMALFLSAITHFDEASGAVVTEMPPTLLECTPTYYDGLPLMNEAGRALGRVRVVRGDRWMYLGWPEPLRWNQKIAMSEIVDADGDGRRTLRMIAAADLKRRNADGTDTVVKAGQRMADLEVARVSDDGYTIWHKDPPEQFLDAAGVVHESWPFHAQKLMTEDGKRTLRSTYPGWDVSLAVEGRRLTAADFPDADGDGRRCLLIGDIMAGDRLDAPTHVVMDQVEPGAWRVRADCGATVQLPAQGDVLVTRRGEKAWPGERVVPRGKPVDLPMEAMAGPGVWLIDQAKQGR
jgi:hypothetical protein